MSQGKDGKALDAFFASLSEVQKLAFRYVGIDRDPMPIKPQH